jgi:hypothetical protein
MTPAVGTRWGEEEDEIEAVSRRRTIDPSGREIPDEDERGLRNTGHARFCRGASFVDTVLLHPDFDKRARFFSLFSLFLVFPKLTQRL